MAEPSYAVLQSVYNQAVAADKTLVGLGFTQTNIDKAEAIEIAVGTATVFVTFDNSTASATNGFPILNTAQPVQFNGRQLLSYMHFFSATGTVNASLLARV